MTDHLLAGAPADAAAERERQKKQAQAQRRKDKRLEERLQAEADSSCSEVFLSGHGGKGGFSPFLSVPLGFSAVFAMREDQSAAGEAYAAEQVTITSRVRFFTQRAFSR
jgi:hypothetical protein